jgi:hypothetical protein
MASTRWNPISGTAAHALSRGGAPTVRGSAPKRGRRRRDRLLRAAGSRAVATRSGTRRTENPRVPHAPRADRHGHPSPAAAISAAISPAELPADDQHTATHEIIRPPILRLWIPRCGAPGTSAEVGFDVQWRTSARAKGACACGPPSRPVARTPGVRRRLFAGAELGRIGRDTPGTIPAGKQRRRPWKGHQAAQTVFAGVKDEASYASPGMPEYRAALEHDVIDPGDGRSRTMTRAPPTHRRRPPRSGRTWRDDWQPGSVYNVFKYSMIARRRASVRI